MRLIFVVLVLMLGIGLFGDKYDTRLRLLVWSIIAAMIYLITYHPGLD
jgi:hypothetical protein